MSQQRSAFFDSVSIVAAVCLMAGTVTVHARGASESLMKAPGTVSIIDRSEIEAPDVGNVADLLGRAPGITASDGTDGRAVVRIRGLGSGGTNQPLIIINGIPTDNSSDAMSALNPDDIKSIQVLKGAAGAALYGTRGSSGVINITTRKPAQTTTELLDEQLGASLGSRRNSVLGAGLYSEFAGGLTGALEYNRQCDFGPATVSPGWALNPWMEQDWNSITPYGDGFMIPFDGLPDAAPPAEPSAPTQPDTEPEPEQAPAASAESSGPAAEPAVEEPSELQRWTRGIPPWSLVRRSPECADVLEELKPLYEVRDQARADIVYYGDFTLSDWQLRENEPELKKA